MSVTEDCQQMDDVSSYYYYYLNCHAHCCSAGPLTQILIQFGLGRLPFGSSGFGSLLPPDQLLLKALVQVAQLAGPHHRRVSLNACR